MKIKISHIRLIVVIIATVLCHFDTSFSQWVNDPSSNTKLVIDPLDPVNLVLLKDLSGGGYVFWEDKKINATNDIYFIHFNENGEVSFRADGKVISTRSRRKG